MTNLKRHEQWWDLIPSIQDFFRPDNFFNAGFLKNWEASLPAVNIRETEKAYEFELAVPGMTKKDIKVEVENDMLIIQGEKKLDEKEETRKYTRREFHYDSFRRVFRIPEDSVTSEINAEFKDGILCLSLPRIYSDKGEAKTRKIEIK